MEIETKLRNWDVQVLAYEDTLVWGWLCDTNKAAENLTRQLDYYFLYKLSNIPDILVEVSGCLVSFRDSLIVEFFI